MKQIFAFLMRILAKILLGMFFIAIVIEIDLTTVYPYLYSYLYNLSWDYNLPMLSIWSVFILSVIIALSYFILLSIFLKIGYEIALRIFKRIEHFHRWFLHQLNIDENFSNFLEKEDSIKAFSLYIHYLGLLILYSLIIFSPVMVFVVGFFLISFKWDFIMYFLFFYLIMVVSSLFLLAQDKESSKFALWIIHETEALKIRSIKQKAKNEFKTIRNKNEIHIIPLTSQDFPICPYCEFKDPISSNGKFCENCGTKLIK